MKTLLAIHHADDELDTLRDVIDTAKAADMHLNVVVLGVIRVAPMIAAPGVPDFYYSEINQAVFKTCTERVKQLTSLVAKENLSATISLECHDAALIEQTILRHAMFCDATVFQNRTALSNDLRTRAFNGALLDTGTPVLVLGAGGTKLPDVKTVMYAWNGEPQAAKAVHHSLNWVAPGAEARIVIVDPDENSMGPNPGDDLAAFLARQKPKY